MNRVVAKPTRRGRSGLTLAELVISMAIVSLLLAALVGLANTAQHSNEFSQGYGTAAQHARVVIERIRREASGATASENFPGVLVLDTWVGLWRFPDRLVVWHPEGGAADPDGGPLMQELVVYCVNPSAPNELLEVTSPGDANPAPSVLDEVAWHAAIDAMLGSASTKQIVLTDLVRVANVPEAGPTAMRGCVRFGSWVRPNQTEWNNYKMSLLAWEDLNWPQDIYGSQTGLRQTWLHWEMQLVPDPDVVSRSADEMPALPFFGSAALYYELDR